jgi:hypothetical protein
MLAKLAAMLSNAGCGTLEAVGTRRNCYPWMNTVFTVTATSDCVACHGARTSATKVRTTKTTEALREEVEGLRVMTLS